MLDGKIHIRQCLRLNSLTGVNQEQRAFAGGNGAGDLVSKVDVPRRIDQIQSVFPPVLRRIRNGNRLTFNGNSPFAFNVHAVQNLIGDADSFVNDFGFFNETVG